MMVTDTSIFSLFQEAILRLNSPYPEESILGRIEVWTEIKQRHSVQYADRINLCRPFLNLERALQTAQKGTNINWSAGIGEVTYLGEVMNNTLLLGHAVVEEAIKVLPDSLKESAVHWSRVSADEQRQICVSLQRELSEIHLNPERHEKWRESLLNDTIDAREPDYQNQPLERIFPHDYNPKTGGHPNCLAKGQMLVAWARLAGATIVGVTPLTTSHSAAIPITTALEKEVLQLIERFGLTLEPHVKKAFSSIENAQSNEEYPNCFHMGIAFKLADNSWYLVDPHMQCGGTLDKSDSLADAAIAVLEHTRLHPGMTMLGTDSSSEKRLVSVCAKATAILRSIERACELFHTHNKDPRAVIPSLLYANVLEHIFCDRPEINLEEQLQNMTEISDLKPGDMCFFHIGLGEYAMLLPVRNSTSKVMPAKEVKQAPLLFQMLRILLGDTWESLAPKTKLGNCKSEAELLQAASRTTQQLAPLLLKGFEACITRLLTLALKVPLVQLGFNESGTAAVHPMAEVYEPTFRIGVELLAHMNAVGEQRNEVVMDLARICSGQHHLLLAATEPLRTGEITPFAKNVAQLLQLHPVRLKDADAGLEALVSRGFLDGLPDSETPEHMMFQVMQHHNQEAALV